MKNKNTRTYNSIVRQKQAEDTKLRVADAAEELIKSQGYESTTISSIAKKAGVATQTVYAIFNSKQGILTFILKRSLSQIKMDVNFESAIQNEDISGIARQVAAVTTKYGQEQISTVNALGGFELLYPELYSLMKEAALDRRASIEAGVAKTLAARGIKLSAEKKKTLIDILWAFTDNHLHCLLVLEAGWPFAKFERLFQKIMEMVMGELAPDMLKSIDE